MKKGSVLTYLIVMLVSIFYFINVSTGEEDKKEVLHLLAFGEVNDSLVEPLIVAVLERKPFTLLINSPGGSVDSAMSFYNVTKKTNAKIKTVCVGTASSAATILFCSAEKRLISRRSYIFLHSISSTGTLGINATKNINDFLTQNYAEVIALVTGGKLTTEDVIKMMKEETFISGEEAVKLGIATELTD